MTELNATATPPASPPSQEPGAPIVNPTPSSTAPANWYEADPYKSHVQGNEGHFKKYTSADEFTKASVEAMKRTTTKAVPDKNDPNYAEKVNAIFDTLERPTKADQYEIKIIEVPPELEGRIAISDELKGKAAEVAAKHRLSQEAFNELASLQQQAVIDAETAWLKQRLEAADATEALLAKEANFPADKELVKRLMALEEYKGLPEEMDSTGWGNSPVLFRILRDAARAKLGEGTMDPASPNSSGGGGGKPDSITAQQRAEYEADKARWPHSSPTLWRHHDKFGGK